MYLSPIHDSFIVLPNTSIHLNLTKKKVSDNWNWCKGRGGSVPKNSALEAKVSPLSFSDCWIRSARLSHCVLLVFSNTDRPTTNKSRLKSDHFLKKSCINNRNKTVTFMTKTAPRMVTLLLLFISYLWKICCSFYLFSFILINRTDENITKHCHTCHPLTRLPLSGWSFNRT